MLCYRCGSHVQDGAEKCWNCGTQLASSAKSGSIDALRERQRTRSRLAGVVHKIGDLIANRYQVKDICGTGGAGVVYKAHDQEIDVDVALKVVNAKLLQTAEERRLFSMEAKLARKLSHQNIVRIYDEGKDGERSFLTMQFLEGLPLRKIIDLRKGKEQKFALEEIEPIFNQLCQALQYAHKTTFHGNLKPDNVIILPDLLKITDFALMRGLPRKPFLAIQKSRGSNFHYYAPEVRHEVVELDSTIDVYSLGVILWEMLTGEVYDDSKSESLNDNSYGIDAALVRVVKRCVARGSSERYPSAGVLYDDLRSLMGEAPSKKRRKKRKKKAAAASAERPSSSADKGSKAKADSAPSDAPTARPEPSMELDAPTQRLDVDESDAPSVHVGRDELDSDAPSQNPPPPPAATGTYEAIEDEMIESAAAGTSSAAPLEIPPPADDDDEVFHDPTEAHTGELPAMDVLNESDIELIADPRATNVIDISGHVVEDEDDLDDEDETYAVVPEMGSGDALDVVSGEAELKREAEEEGMRGDVIVNMSSSGESASRPPTPPGPSLPPEPAFTEPGDATQAGRLDVPAGRRRPSRSINQAATPTAPVDRRGLDDPEMTMDGEGVPQAPSQRPSIPRSPTTGMKKPSMGRKAGGGASKQPQAGGSASRRPKVRPATRPRMAAIRPPSTPPTPAPSSRPSAAPSIAPRKQQRLPPVVLAAIVLGVAALFGSCGVLYAVYRDQQAASADRIARLEARIGQLTSVEGKAIEGEQSAKAAAETARREAEAARQAEAREKAKAEQEAAKKREAEAAARKAEEAAKAAQEAAAAKAARAEAARRRAEAETAARAEADARRREEAERKRREAKEEARERAEARRERERRAAEKAAERRRKLEQERAALAEKRKEDRERRAAAKRAAAEERAERAERERERRAEAARKKAEEAKRRAEEKKRAAEEKKKADEEAALAAAATSDKETCKKGMVLVESGGFMMGAPRNDPFRNFGDLRYQSVEVKSFCIDYYESPNGRGRTPSTGVKYSTAARMCKARGKRLCTEQEWEKACKGQSGLRYPYGNQWDPERCATEDDEGNDRSIAKSGTYRKCRSGYNVFDMSGNAAEWTSTKWGSGYVIKGGSAQRPGYDARCAARKKKSKSYSSETVGFRCCANPR